MFRILFITSTRLGDAVLSTGLLQHLLRTHPDARVTVACGPVAAPLFERMPGRDRTLVMEKRRFDLHWLALWRRCVLRRWDLVVDLRGSAVSFLLPARRRVVMRGGRRPGHRTRHLAAVLGLVPPPQPVVWFSDADCDRADALLPPNGPLIGLGPTANWSGKVWPADRFVALFERIAAIMPGAVPVVFAGPGEAERAMARPVLDALPGAVDLCGRLSLPQVAACLSRCALFVGNDSGLMHLSAAAGTPTLGLFGPSRSSEYAPAGPRAAFVEAPGEPGIAPIAGLSVEDALRAATALLEPSATPRPVPVGAS
ncbi:glycosyltransferase family 9 protein [Acetobacteraceae bacterium KSS12]|uniref:Glycosyltransferase family 9 protein n=1 Tax=Rhizosaccharibacter radicis TaxID=2782605 RepID=A0ABT1VY65_9PROT|nr:glycosyltransferase family 9 protein [Acetobacteraceae bacterium KSS12]